MKKAIAAIKGKVWPILRPLLSVAASALPGPAKLVAQRLLTPKPIIEVEISAEAKSDAPLSLSTDPGNDKYSV